MGVIRFSHGRPWPTKSQTNKLVSPWNTRKTFSEHFQMSIYCLLFFFYPLEIVFLCPWEMETENIQKCIISLQLLAVTLWLAPFSFMSTTVNSYCSRPRGADFSLWSNSVTCGAIRSTKPHQRAPDMKTALSWCHFYSCPFDTSSVGFFN